MVKTFFLKVLMLHIKLKEKTRRAKFKQMFDLMQNPELLGWSKRPAIEIVQIGLFLFNFK